MTRRMTTAVFAGLLAALLLVGVGIGAYRAGQAHDPATVIRDGEVVRVVGFHHWGPPFGFLFFAVILGLVAFALLARRGRGFGPWGPGWGPPGGYGDGREEMLRRWHEQAHGAPAPEKEQDRNP